MELSIIRNEQQYQQFLDWVDVQLDKGVKPTSALGRKVEVALLLIKQYEDMYHPIPHPDPITAIRERMEELGLRNQDLVGLIGSKGHVSSILSGRKPLTIEIARIIHRELNIPAEVLLG